MSADQMDYLFALAIGFAVAGLLAAAYQWLTLRPASFHLLQGGPQLATLAAVPLLVFAAPFIIMRNTLRRSGDGEGSTFGAVMVATILAGCWSLMSGTAVIMALAAFGLPAG